jgi:general secretion pathway protein G
MNARDLAWARNSGAGLAARATTGASNQSNVNDDHNEGNQMLQRSLEKHRSNEGGFTLIELLVVIVILGILAAIVVFAIGGLSDSAKSTSCTADAKTLQTAEDAYYAAPDANGNPHGVYVDEAALVTAKLIKAPGSTKYDLAATGGGTGYSGTAAGGSGCPAFTGP